MSAPISKVAGFSLVEVTLALGLTAFCLVAIFSLLPIGIASNQAAIEQTIANGILSAVTADLRATSPTSPPGQATKTGQFSIPIPANPVQAGGPDTTLYFTSDGKLSDLKSARQRVTISFPTNIPPNSDATKSAKAATFVSLKVSWPPSVDPVNGQPAGTVQTFVALDRN